MVSWEAVRQGCKQDGEGAEGRLVDGLLRGDARSWRDFQVQYGRFIASCIQRILSRFAGQTEEDALSEIYASLLVDLLARSGEKLRAFDGSRGQPLQTWLGLLAANATFDHLRAMRRRPHGAPIDECEELWSEAPSPHELMERKELVALVSEILEDLSDKDREFLELYFGEGLGPDEVAARMQISVKTVYTKKHKIQSRIEARLSDRQLAA